MSAPERAVTPLGHPLRPAYVQVPAADGRIGVRRSERRALRVDPA